MQVRMAGRHAGYHLHGGSPAAGPLLVGVGWMCMPRDHDEVAFNLHLGARLSMCLSRGAAEEQLRS